jgi:hypothetical protein
LRLPPAIFVQVPTGVENTPSEGTMRAATLQGQVDRLISTFLVGVLWGIADGPITMLPSILFAPCRAASARKRHLSFTGNVRSGIDRRKCRLGIMRMRAGYRNLRRRRILNWHRRRGPAAVRNSNNKLAGTSADCQCSDRPNKLRHRSRLRGEGLDPAGADIRCSWVQLDRAVLGRQRTL